MKQSSLPFLMYVFVGVPFSLNTMESDQDPIFAKPILGPHQLVTFDEQAEPALQFTALPQGASVAFFNKLNAKYHNLKNNIRGDTIESPSLEMNFEKIQSRGRTSCGQANIHTNALHHSGLCEASQDIANAMLTNQAGLDPSYGKIFVSCAWGKFDEAIYAFTQQLILEFRGQENSHILTFEPLPEAPPFTKIMILGKATATKGKLQFWGESPYTLTLSQESTRGKS